MRNRNRKSPWLLNLSKYKGDLGGCYSNEINNYIKLIILLMVSKLWENIPYPYRDTPFKGGLFVLLCDNPISNIH